MRNVKNVIIFRSLSPSKRCAETQINNYQFFPYHILAYSFPRSIFIKKEKDVKQVPHVARVHSMLTERNYWYYFDFEIISSGNGSWSRYFTHIRLRLLYSQHVREDGFGSDFGIEETPSALGSEVEECDVQCHDSCFIRELRISLQHHCRLSAMSYVRGTSSDFLLECWHWFKF